MPRGFAKEDFADAWARYLTHDTAPESATTPQVSKDKDLGSNAKRHMDDAPPTCGVLESGKKPNKSNGCGGVAFPSEERWALCEERAAIREYEGGYSRSEAERLATIEVFGGGRSYLRRGRELGAW